MPFPELLGMDVSPSNVRDVGPGVFAEAFLRAIMPGMNTAAYWTPNCNYNHFDDGLKTCIKRVVAQYNDCIKERYMLNETDFVWHVRHANNIPTNPIDCYYCIVDTGDGTGKMYVVKPLSAQNTDGMVEAKYGYKYFVFIDCSVQRVPADQRNFPHSMSLYSGYRKVSETLIAIFDTLEEAKLRAYTQYAHHYGYVLPHVVDDIAAKTRQHFVVAENS